MRPYKTVVGLVACVSLLAGTLSRGNADTKADAVIRKAIATTRATKTLRASFKEAREKGSLRIMRPYYIQMEQQGTSMLPERFYCDGKSVWMVDAAKKEYMVSSAQSLLGSIRQNEDLDPLTVFLFPDTLQAAKQRRYLGSRKRNGVTYTAVAVFLRSDKTRYTLYFGASGLLEGTESGNETGGKWLERVRVNAPMTAKEFAFVPPQDYKKITEQENAAQSEKAAEDEYTRKLLPVGATAPDFTLPTADGKTVQLSELLKGKKAVLVNFFFVDCPPCRREFPEFVKLYTDLKDKGLEIISISRGDSAADVQKFASELKMAFPLALAGEKGGKDYAVLTQYKVPAYPTNYLLDSEGKILFHSVGYSPTIFKSLTAALENAGLK